MPRGDGTGPNGQGPMTGRAMGFCAGFNVPGFMNPGFGQGTGRGFGRGRGFAWRARAVPFQQIPIQQVQPAVITEKQEREYLKEEMDALKQEMQEIEARLKELKE